MRELRRKGQGIEALAVGFGVSYNTVRNVLKEDDPTIVNEEGQQPRDRSCP